MATNAYTSRLLLDALSHGVLDEEASSLDDQMEITDELRIALLAIGSETPSNLEAVAHIEFAAVKDDDRSGVVMGPKFIGEPILLSHLFWRLEGEPMPANIREAFPRLSKTKWDAALRFIVLLLSGLERDLMRARHE